MRKKVKSPRIPPPRNNYHLTWWPLFRYSFTRLDTCKHRDVCRRGPYHGQSLLFSGLISHQVSPPLHPFRGKANNAVCHLLYLPCLIRPHPSMYMHRKGIYFCFTRLESCYPHFSLFVLLSPFKSIWWNPSKKAGRDLSKSFCLPAPWYSMVWMFPSSFNISSWVDIHFPVFAAVNAAAITIL